MSLLEINQNTCTRCGICAEECPGHLIFFKEGRVPRLIPQAEDFCIGCGHCVAVCPSGSLSHRSSPVEKSLEILPDLLINPEQCEQFIKSRRSVRVFRDQPVPRETITRLIEVARYAPTGHNDQEVNWLVIDSKKELEHLEELGIGWIEWIMQNQPQMASAFNMEQMLKMQKKNSNVFMRGAPVLIITHGAKDNGIACIDSVTALSYLDLAANSLGLGTCWAGFVYFMANSYPPVKEALALPEDRVATGCMMLGYNKFNYRRIPLRNEPVITWR